MRDAAGKLGLAALLARKPSQLSGGQRQRVALGRAMVRQPAVFLMDEPLSNLDAALRISMRAEIKHLHGAMQTTFVYVTHDQAEALTLADRIVVMNDGVIQQIGTPDEIYEHPRNMFVASFLGNPPINWIEGGIEILGRHPVFRRGNLKIALPQSVFSRLSAVEGELALGIRPEDVVAGEVGADAPAISGVVDTVLPIGSDRFLDLKVEDLNLFVRVDKHSGHREGDHVRFGLVPDRLHLFDKASGNSVFAGGAA